MKHVLKHIGPPREHFAFWSFWISPT